MARRSATADPPNPLLEGLAPNQRAFLAALAKTGNVTAAGRASGIYRSTHYDWLKNERYKAAAADAIEAAADLLEEEARRRAYEGVIKPIFQGGKKVGSVREFPENLMIVMLRAAKPEKYRERSDVNHSGSIDIVAQAARTLDQKLLSGIAAETADNVADKPE